MTYFVDNLLNFISKLLLSRSKNWQAESSLRELNLWDLEVNKKDHLALQGKDTIDLIEKYGSPLLVVNQDRLKKDAGSILKAISKAPSGSSVLYSYKTNCIPGILKQLHALEIGAEVISPYELWLAGQLGVPGNMIVYNGVNKTEKSLEKAVNMDVLAVNIDQEEEVDRIYGIARKLGKKVNVGVRLGLVEKSQFGLVMETGEAIAVCKKILSLNDFLQFNCVHFNVTSNAKSSDVHKLYINKALDFIKDLKVITGMDIPYLDIGGGFGVPTTKNLSGMEYAMYRTFGLLPKAPIPKEFQPIESYLEDIVQHVVKVCRKLNLRTPSILIEPGRFVTSRSEFLLAKVLAIKEKANGTRYIITEAGRLSMTFPCDFEYHEIFVANRVSSPRDNMYNIMGRICTSADWMAKNRLMPQLQPGDVLAIMDAGAYFSSYSTNFAFPRPGIVMVTDGKAEFIRKAESFEHLTAMDVI